MRPDPRDQSGRRWRSHLEHGWERSFTHPFRRAPGGGKFILFVGASDGQFLMGASGKKHVVSSLADTGLRGEEKESDVKSSARGERRSWIVEQASLGKRCR